jgi:ATPase subunit of ABC transporter with duplicated ATPase domains
LVDRYNPIRAALCTSIPMYFGGAGTGAPVWRPIRTLILGELEQDRAALTGPQPLLEIFRDFEEGTARTLLAKFGLGAEDVLRSAASLSPGERTRAGLALLTARGVNCLVLDEPTNHLDVEAIEELERGLAGYDGTVILVTHDRRFLEAFAPGRTIEL